MREAGAAGVRKTRLVGCAGLSLGLGGGGDVVGGGSWVPVVCAEVVVFVTGLVLGLG